MKRMLYSETDQSFRAGIWWFGVVLLWICLSIPVSAIDPLPPALEEASPQDQQAYIERFNRDMMRDKMEVARERFDRRMRYKTQMTEGLKFEAETRKAAIQREVAMRQQQTQQSNRKSFLVFQILAGMVIVSGGLFLLRNPISNAQFRLQTRGE